MKSRIQKSNYISMTIHEIYKPDRSVTDYALKEIRLNVALNINKGKAKAKKDVTKRINDSIKNEYTVAKSVNDKKSSEFRRKIENVIDVEFDRLKKDILIYIQKARKSYKKIQTWEDLQEFANTVNKGDSVKLEKSRSHAINIVHKDVTSTIMKEVYPHVVETLTSISSGEIALSVMTGGVMWVTIQRLTRRVISEHIKQLFSEFLNRFLRIEERNFKGFYT